MIVASARVEGLTLITSDKPMLRVARNIGNGLRPGIARGEGWRMTIRNRISASPWCRRPAPRTRTPTSTKPPTAFAKLPAPAPMSSACQSYFAPSIFVSGKIMRSSISPSRFPAPRRKNFAASRKKSMSLSSLPCSNAALPASTTTPPPLSSRTDRSPENIARCIFPTIPSTTKSFISLPAISAFAISRSTPATLACWSAGISGIRKAHASPHCKGANVLFYPTAIGWHPAEKAEYGDAQYSAWQTMQRAHAIANGVYVGAVNRVGHEHGDIRGNRVEGAGLEFWGGSFLADPFGRVILQAAHDKEDILIGEIDLHLIEETRATGLFCATAASTPINPSRNAFWMNRLP